MSKLSERQQQVFELVGQGLSWKAVGLELGISVNTAKLYGQRILRKLGMSDGPGTVQFRLIRAYYTAWEDPPD